MCEFICIERVCVVLFCYYKVKSAISETALVSKKKRMVPFDWLVLANKQQNVALKTITLKK